MTLDILKKKNLPNTPGVYFFKHGPKILYIGRATSLKDRVKSYFSNDVIATRGPRIVDMVTRASAVEWQEADSVLEAIILEANLIKKHLPDYNVKEKDDKSFNYVCITKESFPRILIVRGRNLNFSKLSTKDYKLKTIYGPFTSTTVLRTALRIIRKMFPFLDEKSIAKDAYRFYRQLGLTPDTASPEARKAYMSHIRHIQLFLSGKKSAVIQSLKREMRAHAKLRQFEKAGEVKRRIFALEHIQDVALIKEDSSETIDYKLSTNNYRLEAYDTAHISGTSSVGVMTVIENGELAKNEYRKFKLSPKIGNDDIASLSEIIKRRFSHPEWKFPDVAVIDGGIGQRNRAVELISKLSPKTKIVSVVKNQAHKPKGIIGDEDTIKTSKKLILLVNGEAHRFAITYHRKLRGKI